jgi:hypothetical protein
MRSAIPPMHGDLCFRSSDGDVAIVPGVVMNGYAGTEYLTLSNDDQGLPLSFKLRMKMRPDFAEANFELHTRTPGWSVTWYARALAVNRTAAKGAVMTFRDFETGVEHGLGRVLLTNHVLPAMAHYELVARAERVQDRTKQPILTPERDFFTDDDIDDLLFIESVVGAGIVEAVSVSTTITNIAGKTRDDWRAVLTSASVNLSLRSPKELRKLLDSVIDLGPTEIEQDVRFSVLDVESAIDKLEADGALTVTVVAASEPYLRVKYPYWLSTSHSNQDPSNPPP